MLSFPVQTLSRTRVVSHVALRRRSCAITSKMKRIPLIGSGKTGAPRTITPAQTGITREEMNWVGGHGDDDNDDDEEGKEEEGGSSGGSGRGDDGGDDDDDNGEGEELEGGEGCWKM